MKAEEAVMRNKVALEVEFETEEQCGKGKAAL